MHAYPYNTHIYVGCSVQGEISLSEGLLLHHGHKSGCGTVQRQYYYSDTKWKNPVPIQKCQAATGVQQN